MKYPKTFPLLPLRAGVLLPGGSATLPVGRARSVALVEALDAGDIIGIGFQRDRDVEYPSLADLQPIGVFARVRRSVRVGRRGYRLVVDTLQRFELDSLQSAEPYCIAAGRPIPDVSDDPVRSGVLADVLRERLAELAKASTGGVATSLAELAKVANPGRLADRTAAGLGLGSEAEVRVLLTTDVGERLELVTQLLGEAETRDELKKKIDSEVRRDLAEGQREAVLRKQLEAIRKELGDDAGDDADELARRVAEADLPDEVREVAQQQLKRLRSGGGGAEGGVIRTYLDWILALPWRARAEERFDFTEVEAQLDADHHGLDEVKKRILEHLAVLSRGGSAGATILCLAGPPGVGKTSLGQSVADATGRPFVRIALGGVRDEAELRGHRRTYVGALPGRIVHALKQVGANNPVMLLDEVDKLGRGWMGSPEAALLEVLDPEQNDTFTDHYMELPFDLSDVLFICTANDLSQLSAPLRDRMEIIQIDGYTVAEKVQIARDHLIPKQLEKHALGDELLSIDDDALAELIAGWTRESGVRQLQRNIRKLCRALSLQLAREPDRKPEPLVVTPTTLAEHLGKRRFFDEIASRTALPGVATGLAWTPVGGDILFIETSRMRGTGKLQITGQLGDVMKESAQAALTYVRSNAAVLGVDPSFLDESDLHIHVPAGGVPKDGPSAGVTIFTALVSLLTDRRVNPEVGMTGEATLRGRVLPVGGIKTKVLAAHRAGLKTVVLPERNRHDIVEIPDRVLDAMEIVFASDMAEVLEVALAPADVDPLASHAANGGPEVQDGAPAA